MIYHFRKFGGTYHHLKRYLSLTMALANQAKRDVIVSKDALLKSYKKRLKVKHAYVLCRLICMPMMCRTMSRVWRTTSARLSNCVEQRMRTRLLMRLMMYLWLMMWCRWAGRPRRRRTTWRCRSAPPTWSGRGRASWSSCLTSRFTSSSMTSLTSTRPFHPTRGCSKICR